MLLSLKNIIKMHYKAKFIFSDANNPKKNIKFHQNTFNSLCCTKSTKPKDVKTIKINNKTKLQRCDICRNL